MFDQKILKKIKPGEGYLISSPANSFYLNGFTGAIAPFFLTSQKAYLMTDARYFNEAKEKCDKRCSVVNIKPSAAQLLAALAKKHKIKTVYFESEHLTYLRFLKYGAALKQALKPPLKQISFKPSENFIAGFRASKTPQEVANIVKAQRIAEKALVIVTKNLKAGQSEKEVAWQIEKIGRELGAEAVSFEPIIAFGANSAIPHHQNTDKKLKKGNVVLLDIGFKYKGYCSDMTRMVFTAAPTPLQTKIYNLVLEAQEAAIKKIRAKAVACNIIDAIARDIIAKAGYGKNFLHSLGHGVGLEIHEYPRLNDLECDPLPENSVVTVEPGIYLQNSFGVRIEDMVLVRGNKALNLTKAPKLLDQCIVKIK
jgi:Xaa-Pro aminopeptidase